MKKLLIYSTLILLSITACNKTGKKTDVNSSINEVKVQPPFKGIWYLEKMDITDKDNKTTTSYYTFKMDIQDSNITITYPDPIKPYTYPIKFHNDTITMSNKKGGIYNMFVKYDKNKYIVYETLSDKRISYYLTQEKKE